MNLLNFAFLGGAVAFVGSIWGQIKSFFNLLRSVIVIEVTADWMAIDALLLYLNDHHSRLFNGNKQYFGQRMRLGNLTNPQVVVWEVMNRVGFFYRQGLRLLWVQPQGRLESGERKSGIMSGVRPDQLKLVFVRGQWDPDELLTKATAYYNESASAAHLGISRHRVVRVVGVSAKRAMMARDSRDGEGPHQLGWASGSDDFLNLLAATPVSHDLSQFGNGRYQKLEDMALSKEVSRAVREARRWYQNRGWYEQRGIPWRRGWLLHGEVGTGKTALSRALARELDLPVYLYDLSSLSNDEMVYEWTRMLASVPCMALLEDIDSVFKGRKTISGELTFDCLLNCLDGVEHSDGLFTIITTNNPDYLDPALAQAWQTRATRPGRVDRVLHMGNPDKAGREKIARRILAGLPAGEVHLDHHVREGVDMTGAQFQEYCFQVAQAESFSEKL